MKRVSIGIHVPAAAVASLGSGESYTEFFRQAEALGLDALWTEDRIFHAANVLDPLMLLASAASCTRRIQLGVSLGGRPEEYRAVGVPMERRVAVFRESVAALRRAGELADGWIMLGVPTLDLAHLRRVAEEVAPVLRETAAR